MGLWLGLAVLTFGSYSIGETVTQTGRAVSPTVVTNFEQIWQMTKAESNEWHRLRMEYVVYYYDPLWRALWGRCGDSDSYLSVGSDPFPIKPHQRILVEGLIMPVRGMIVEEPKVTVLAENAPVEVLSTSGEIGNTTRFNKRLVTVEGYVDRQAARDANHQELDLIVEGQSVLVQFLVHNGEAVPQLSGSLLRVQGVYFARSEPSATLPQLEIWVPGTQSIQILGRLENDERFRLPPTKITQLPKRALGEYVRVVGSVLTQQPGKSLTIRDDTGQLTLHTAQTQPMAADEQVEAIGRPLQQGADWILEQGIFRPGRSVITSFEELSQIPADQQKTPHRVRLDFLFFCHDPFWKVAFGRCAGSDNYLPLGELPFPVTPGQRVLIEGIVVPANGMAVDEAKYTQLSDPEPLPAALDTKGHIDSTERFQRHRVLVEGYVVQQTLIDRNHLKIDILTEGRPVTVRLTLDGETVPPKLKGSQVRVTGVYSATSDPLGGPPKLEVWVQEQQDIEAVGFPTAPAINPDAPKVITSYEDLMLVPEDQKKQMHSVRLDFLSYFHDPLWKVAWGRCAGTDSYITLGELPFSIKPGQRVLIEGQVIPANGMTIENPKAIPLADPVPLNTLVTKKQIGQTERFDRHMVTVEGYVDQQAAPINRRVRVDLVTEGRAVTVHLLLDPEEVAPRLEDTLLRVKGVYSATNDPLGGLPKIEVWVQGLRNIEVIGSIARDERFDVAATSIEKSTTIPAGMPVRIEGTVRLQQPGKSITIRDETGQITLPTVQTLSLQIGERVEAIGVSTKQGNDSHLSEIMYRRAKTTPNGADSAQLANLRLAEQVRELSPEEAARSHPVQLSGIVTWADPKADFFFVQDSSGGLCIIQPAERNAKLITGSKVDISGESAPGKFTPIVHASTVVPTARLDPPEANHITLEQALTGIEDSQWVSMNGYVRNVIPGDPWVRLELTTSAGEFTAQVPWNAQLLQLRGSVVRLRGVCQALSNAKRQLIGVQLWVPSFQFIAIEEAEPADPYTVVTRSIASLRQFNSLPALNRRVRVAGVVIHHAPGLRLLIQEGTEGLLVLSRDTTPLAPGDRIEAVGFPGRENGRTVLREAVYRRLSSGTEPAPQEVNSLDTIDVELDNRLVRIEATLLDLSAQEKGTELIMQAGEVVFEAMLEIEESLANSRWVPGSRLSLTGVYQVQFDEYKRPHDLRLQLRSLQDVTILARAPWWTARRALAASGVLAIGILLGVGWVIALRRRVRQQIGQIHEQVESEKAARLEAALARASKLESLGVLAGGIAHDFNNLLTVVLGNLSLAKLDRRIEPETIECLQEGERAAQRARDLTQQLITFAKGGEPVRAVTPLPEVVRDATRFALHGSKVRCDFDLALDAWPAEVDKGQIGQVVHNIIINATHAMPDGGVIRIGLRNEEIAPGVHPALSPGRYLRMTIADTGTGIGPEHLPRIFDPYYTTKAKGSGLGLASVYSIIKKHQGHIEVESKLGEGTTFRLWLPAVTDVPPAVEATVVAKPQSTQSARVLLMDDEASIRQLGGAIFKRLGVEHTAVADGAAVLREYESAQTEGRPYDLVMLDLTVPGGMGGAEAMEKLLRLDPKVKAIVSSGYSHDPVMANYRAYGFLGVVPKPYIMSEFVKTIGPILPTGLLKGNWH